jgi:hypothetical protein
MVIGAFGPWIKATAPLIGSLTVSGTDGSNDGWGVVVLAPLGALFLYAAQGAFTRTSRLFTSLLALASGAAAAAICIYDRGRINDVPADVAQTALVSVGWGLNLALAASCVFTVTASTLLFRRASRTS